MTMIENSSQVVGNGYTDILFFLDSDAIGLGSIPAYSSNIVSFSDIYSPIPDCYPLIGWSSNIYQTESNKNSRWDMIGTQGELIRHDVYKGNIFKQDKDMSCLKEILVWIITHNVPIEMKQITDKKKVIF